MKILQVLHGFPPETTGGTERTVAALAHALQGLGHEVIVASGSLHPAAPDRVDREVVDGLAVLRLHREDLYYESWWKSHCPGLSATFERLLAEHRPDVVHVHHWLRLSSDLARLAREQGAVVAVSLHDYYAVLGSPVRRVGQDVPASPPVSPPMGDAERDEAFAFHRADFQAELAAAQLRYVPCEAHGQGVRDMGLALFGDTLRSLPPPLLEPPARANVGGDRQRRLITWGSIYPDKGLDSVLSALREIGPQPELSLQVFGDAHDPEYGRRLRELGDGLPVQFHGSFAPADLSAAEADFALLPSLCHESYGLVLDEALCLGWPLLCADVPAYRQRLPAGCGLLYPPGDVGALVRLLQDEAALAGLQVPPVPELATAADIARQLDTDYRAIADGAAVPTPEVDAITDADRAALYFRRAERRNWSALQQPKPPIPPW